MLTEMNDVKSPLSLSSALAWIRNRFFAGLFVVLPIALTIWILKFLYQGINGPCDHLVRELIARQWLPGSDFFRVHHQGTIPGAGFVLTVLLLILVGVLMGNFMGRTILRWVDHLLDHLPVVRSIYSGIKQAFDAVRNLGSEERESCFSQVVYVPYPGTGGKMIGFVTSRFRKEDGRIWCSVFLPAAPSPLTGLVIYFPEEELVIADMNVEEATKVILSMGLVIPKPVVQTGKG